MCWEGFSRYIQFEAGLGNQVQFWHDCWCGDQILREDFPILFEIAIVWEAVGRGKELGCEIPV